MPKVRFVLADNFVCVCVCVCVCVTTNASKKKKNGNRRIEFSSKNRRFISPLFFSFHSAISLDCSCAVKPVLKAVLKEKQL